MTGTPLPEWCDMQTNIVESYFGAIGHNGKNQSCQHASVTFLLQVNYGVASMRSD